MFPSLPKAKEGRPHPRKDVSDRLRELGVGQSCMLSAMAIYLWSFGLSNIVENGAAGQREKVNLSLAG